MGTTVAGGAPASAVAKEKKLGDEANAGTSKKDIDNAEDAEDAEEVAQGSETVREGNSGAPIMGALGGGIDQAEDCCSAAMAVKRACR